MILVGQWYLWFVLYPLYGIICCIIAYKKNRNAVGWFFGGFIFGIFAIIIIAGLKKKIKEDNSLSNESEQLMKLHDDGIITDEQYKAGMEKHNEKLKQANGYTDEYYSSLSKSNTKTSREYIDEILLDRDASNEDKKARLKELLKDNIISDYEYDNSINRIN